VGKVKWFNGVYGFILRAPGEVFVHKSDVMGMIGKGDHVTFNLEKNEKDHDRARHVRGREYQEAQEAVTRLLATGEGEADLKALPRRIRRYAKRILKCQKT
jgi:cold shock CspA family protein